MNNQGSCTTINNINCFKPLKIKKFEREKKTVPKHKKTIHQTIKSKNLRLKDHAKEKKIAGSYPNIIEQPMTYLNLERMNYYLDNTT